MPVIRGKLLRLACLAGSAVVAGALLGTVPTAGTQAAGPRPGNLLPRQRPPTNELADPSRLLPSGWRTSRDRAVTVAGDATGLHVLVAAAAAGYQWHTVATLGVRGTDTTQWIGQACLTGSGERAVVVYAPRQITNAPDALGYGALAAVVNLSTGKVTQLGAGVSIAYFDPGCGTGQSAVLTQGGTGASPYSGPVDTSLMVLNAATGKITSIAKVPGQVTSAVPFGGGIAGVYGRAVVSISTTGRVRKLAAVAGQAFRLAPDSHGGLGFLVAAGKKVQVRRYAAGHDTLVGTAALGSAELSQVGGNVFITGLHATGLGRMPAAWHPLDVLAGSQVSSTGMLAVSLASTGIGVNGKSPLSASPSSPQPVRITAEVAATKAHVSFQIAASTMTPGVVMPAALPGFPAYSFRAGSTSGQVAQSASVSPPSGSANPATTTYDPVRACSVPRNYPNAQTYQPSQQQVEWAVDQAVQNKLTNTQPANLYGSGLPAFSPQDLFPGPAGGLAGGGSVPAQVLLGILSQESNEDQASNHAIIGQTGNFMPSYNWYGTNGVTGPGTTVDWSNADCGYGIGQITSGMCLSGFSGCASPMSYEDQLAIAVDYESNIAAALQILEQKWNQLHGLGILANGGDPAYIENWWFAIWAYNSGLEPDAANGNTTGCSPSPTCTDAPGNGSGGNWGLGWVDNPANPLYPPDRPMFLAQGPSGSTYNYNWDEANPAGWSYEEKVIGFAAYGLVSYSYVNASWGQSYATASYPVIGAGAGASTEPQLAQPAVSEFCSTASATDDNCDPADAGTSSACQLTNDHCWWHWPITWVACSSYCGQQVLTYASGAANPGSPGVPAGYAPQCSSSPLPSTAIIVGDTASSIPAPLGCGTSWSNNGGTMTWNFAPDDATSPVTYPSKVDFHQIGGGYSGHYWFTHTIPNDQETPTYPISTVPNTSYADLAITGTWTPPSTVTGWTKIMAAIPDEGAWDPQANYQISLGNGTAQDRVVNQAFQTDTWVPLGIFDLSAGANVSLTNVTFSGLGYDIAWDAMAFIPSSTPTTDYVAMGDSYSSGEGLQPFDGNSDYNYSGMVDACHRSGLYGSAQAYPALVTTPGQSEPIAEESEGAGSTDEFMFLACSGDVSSEMAVQAYDDEENGVDGGTVAQSCMTNTPWCTYSLGYNELPQASEGWLTPQTTLVTLTAGGDDARFAAVIKGCLLTLTDCVNGSYVLTDNGTLDPAPLTTYEPEVITALQPHLEALYQQIASEAPNAEIIVLGYPRLFPDDTDAPSCAVDAVLDIPANQTSWMNQMGDDLNTVVADAVAYEAAKGVDIKFINPTTAFTGHEICSSDPWINGLITESKSGSSGSTPTIPGSGSFHPMAAGQEEFATLVDECLAGTLPTAQGTC
jgi:hypothetical protein